MLQGIKDYVKCSVRNKFTLAAYLTIGTNLILKGIETRTGIEIPYIEPATYYFGYLTLGLTSVGRETFQSYRRTKEHIEKFNSIDRRFRDKYLNSKYCNKVGFQLAVEEAGLENLL